MVKLVNVIGALSVFLVLTSVGQQEVEGFEIVTATIIGLQLANGVLNILDKLNIIPSDDLEKADEIVGLINTLSTQIDDVSDKISENRQHLITAVQNLKNFISIEIEMNEVQGNVNGIKERYDKMKLVSRNMNSYRNSTKRAFAEWNVLPGFDSISSKLSSICFTYFGYEAILSERYSRAPLVDKIALEFQFEEMQNLCSPMSAQQYFYNEYLEMILLEIKGFIIEKFSWMILRNLGEDGYTTEEENTRIEHEIRTTFMINKLRNITAAAGREIRTCDPEEWRENENYLQLTRLIQGYIVNEANINEQSSCNLNCDLLTDIQVRGCVDKYCEQDKGTGEILKCESNSKKDFITICPSINPVRRYDYFETNRGYSKQNVLYGERSDCPRTETTVKSWSRGIYKCSYCFCLIDEISEKSDRYFSLGEVLSDVNENKVVTGIRFVKIDRIMYLQIQQGELAPFGAIKENTIGWKNVKTWDFKTSVEGRDYVTFSNNRKSINLDNVIVENSTYVVTGVKLCKLKSHLHLEVRVTSFKFESGMLNYENSSEWISHNFNHNNVVPLRDGDLGRGPKVSTKAPVKSAPSPTEFNVVEFTHSDKQSDAAQTTLPFIDSQNVISQTPTALSGIGIYHKGTEGYGGFLALKIFTYDMSPYL